MFFQFVVMEKS